MANMKKNSTTLVMNQLQMAAQGKQAANGGVAVLTTVAEDGGAESGEEAGAIAPLA